MADGDDLHGVGMTQWHGVGAGNSLLSSHHLACSQVAMWVPPEPAFVPGMLPVSHEAAHSCLQGQVEKPMCCMLEPVPA